MSVVHRVVACALAAVTAVGAGLAMMAPASAAVQSPTPFIGQFHRITNIASTVPANGDVNPYGIVVVQKSRGKLHRGNILVSNFNNKANLQGTGTTIVEISPGGHQTLFAHITRAKLTGPCPGGVGLTTALAVLPGGWVVVGSTPSKNGMATTARAGCLIVLDSQGTVRETISGHGINGPWDMTALSAGGFSRPVRHQRAQRQRRRETAVVHKGTVLRLRVRSYWNSPPKLLAVTKIGSGFSEQTNASAFVIGPTGVGLGRNGTLYVADTGENRITAHPVRGNAHVERGHRVRGDLGRQAQRTAGPGHRAERRRAHRQRRGRPDRGDDTGGAQVAHRFLDTSGSPPGSGALFGLTVAARDGGVYFVDDATNTLRVLH